MTTSSAEHRRRMESLDRAALAEYQLMRLNELLAAIRPANKFYAEKLAHCPDQLESLDQLAILPTTTKDELISPTGPMLLPKNLTWPIENYVHYHQTSGTRGRPLSVFDTAEDWKWRIGDGLQWCGRSMQRRCLQRNDRCLRTAART